MSGQQSGGSGGGRRWRCEKECVEVPVAIAIKNHALGSKVLDRETKRIKLNGPQIVASKLANGKKVTNNRWDDKNIIEMKGSVGRSLYGCVTRTGNRHGSTVPGHDTRGTRYKGKRMEVTIVESHVRGCIGVHPSTVVATMKRHVVECRDKAKAVPTGIVVAWSVQVRGVTMVLYTHAGVDEGHGLRIPALEGGAICQPMAGLDRLPMVGPSQSTDRSIPTVRLALVDCERAHSCTACSWPGHHSCLCSCY